MAKVGRPIKFKSKEDIEKKIQRYFDDCEKKHKPLTITGLAVSLDTNRETLLDYQDKEEFSDTIKRAKEIIHNWTEEYLFTGKNQTGAIFNLKNNYGWKDKTEQDITSGGKPIPILNNGIIPTDNSNKEDISP